MKRWLRGAACALLTLAGAARADDVTIVPPAASNGVVIRSDDTLPGDAPAPKRGVIRSFFSKQVTVAGAVRADDVTNVPPAATNGPVILSEDGLPVDAPAPRGGRLRRCFDKIGVFCYHDRDAFGCESFHSTMQFIFGSCRTFFREPCDPKPPRDGGLLGRYSSGGSGSGSGCTSCGGW